MPESSNVVRDLLYLDFDKASSIWSQFEGGLPERTSVTEDTGKDREASVRLGARGIAQANLGVDYLEKRSILQSKILHHDVLNRIERRLVESGLVVDLSTAVASAESSAEAIRSAIGSRPYLRAEGQSVLEDYKRILAIAERFNEIGAFVAKAGEVAFKQSPAYLELEANLTAVKETADRVSDRNQRALQKAKAKQLHQQLEAATKVSAPGIEEWIVTAMRTLIDTFMPSRINFRIYPFPECPSFQVLCNLKRECFVDSDLEHLLYGYGHTPNVPLAVFGLITSLPPIESAAFDPLKEFEAATQLTDKEAFEKAFRGVFPGLHGLESFVRFSRYPNVTVHPIAVYRSFPVRATR